MPRFRWGIWASLALCGAAPGARAQPAAPAAPITPAPDAGPVPAPPGGVPPVAVPPVAIKMVVPATVAPATGALAERKALTPEERRQQTEERLRALMINMGVTATATQDAIIVYLTEDEMGRASVRDALKRLLTGVRRDAPPERLRDLIGEYRAAIDGDKTRRTQAQSKLDARVGYSFDPKLEAVLWLLGVLGDGQSMLPTGALAFKAPDANNAPDGGPQAPVYGPPVSPNFGARGEIVGTVTAKGISDKGEHWLEIRDDTGALDRYAPLWREDLGALDPEVDAEMTRTQLGARVRVQWLWQERRRALSLQPEDAKPANAAPKDPAPTTPQKP